ncbi:glycosyltransferase [Cellulomonas marina]|uniref:4,4'-diaponeurosporenoate glycosyltransferase n=1 Tax=Cellulomonas marina TaxID=988821 RepID=A0A1I0X0S3_9CELL|nr:glycosyltransferase [Cellulomonas marina]GIG29360.1 hypothetical protein Cma02nite_19600 [Cellulomonas marina]SFA94491.1 Glycosyltransferase involved in cell wall bisynthesis [Cellulomonas marina]
MHKPALVVAAAGGATFLAGLVMPTLAAALERRLAAPAPAAPLTDLGARPSIEVVVPAYLEASTVGECVRTLHEALKGYEGPSSVTVVASDPGTAAAAREAGADEVVETGRTGKPAAANLGAARSTADVLVFTDANCVVGPADWPQRVVDDLRRAHLVSANKQERGRGEGAFWRYEQRAKEQLVAGGGSISVVGEFIATRRTDFLPAPAGAILDDLWLAVEYLLRDRVVLVDPELHTLEDSAGNREQWGRRLRIMRGLLEEMVPRVPELVTRPAGRMFVAHKLYRATVGAAGFWVGAAAASVVAPPVTLVALPAAVAAGAAYAGRLAPDATLPAPVAALGMQAVPPAALWTTLVRRLRPRPAPATTGWEKIAR